MTDAVDRDREVAADVRSWLQLLIHGRRLSPAQRRIARFLVDFPEQAVFLTGEELGQRSGASQPSVTRFAAALGFTGYPELRAELRAHVQAQASTAGGDERAHSVLQRAVAVDVANLQQLASSPWAGERLDRVGRELAASRPLPVLGLRVSRPFADLFGHFAGKVHPDVRVIPAGSLGDDALGVAARAGATWLLAFGLPRYPAELQSSIRWARGLGLRVALVTDSPLCPLAHDVDDLLAAPVSSELTFDSAVAPLALTMGLLQVITDALPAQAQARLDEFDQQAADRGLFID
jgi:DNA-binding MurR/RpiR family transcriptional regulator